MIALSAVQSSTQRFIQNAILFFDTSNSASYDQAHWLIRTPYLSIIASNDCSCSVVHFSHNALILTPIYLKYEGNPPTPMLFQLCNIVDS